MVSAKRRSRILGIALEEHGCNVALLERGAAGVRVVKATGFRMSLDVLKDSPDLVGAELQRHLAAARLTERTCVAVAPTSWFLTAQVPVPEMEAQDVPGYLELQAEHLIPLSLSELHLRSSMFRTPGEASNAGRGATLLALPRSRAGNLLDALRHAQLRPIGLACSSAVLANAHSDSTAVLQIGRFRADFAVSAGGGLVAVRTLRAPEDGLGRMPIDELAREIRISLKRLPLALADEIDSITIYGDPARAKPLCQELGAQLSDLRLAIQVAEHVPGDGVSLTVHESAQVDAAVVVAAMQALEGLRPDPDYLTVKPSRAQQFLRTILERRALSIAAGAAGLAVILGALLLYQHQTLRRLAAEEESLRPQAEVVGALQERVRRYRPWCETAAPTLELAKSLTEAFPVTGDVWLRALIVRDISSVTCSGSARSSRAFLAALDALGATKGVKALKVSQVRGETELDFSFSYAWESGAQ